MIIFLLGFILSIVPFILLNLFSDKKKGFVYVLFFSLLFQSLLGLITQFFGIFYYNVVIVCTLLVDVSIVFFYFKRKKKIHFNIKKFDWLVVFVVIVSALTLYQIHYNYTGQISLATDVSPKFHQVKNMVYPYPYFSDEWYAISLIEGVIKSHSLPLWNNLNNTYFGNLELFFHSFVSEIMLILGLDPLYQYTVLTIFFNTIIVLVAYLFLRINDVSKLSSGIAALMILYVTCGANLPGIWHFVPFISGMLFFLLSACFMELGDIISSSLATLTACLFYPPLIPFCFLAFIVFLFTNSKIPKSNLLKWSLYFIVLLFFVIPISYILLMISPFAGTLSYITSRVFFTTLVGPYIPQLYFFYIIPVPAILLAIFGVYSIFKEKKWILISQLILGIIFWFFNSLTISRFFIEYERAVIFTSTIIVIISGFGLNQFEKYIQLKFGGFSNKIVKTLEIFALMVFVVLIPFYTRGEDWGTAIEVVQNSRNVAYPKAPANNYLTADDLRLFSGIKNKKFLSIPWKGTVIGVATNNYPVLSKPGNITVGSSDTLVGFNQADCSEKYDMAKKLNLDYIYLYKFDCPNFQEIDKSQEGFVLYQLIK